jgi:hypothetical protein
LETFICNVIVIKLVNYPYFFKFQFHNHVISLMSMYGRTSFAQQTPCHDRCHML